ncbi:MAG TPA: polysaccharide biosynthesis protein GtrA [Gammaproteobacteria bacterium]|jgi:putative flippase GtrA|nr:polysaccharide biosynthesis protein GtrA [Gammaproteobacteria bacterium]
MTIKRLIARYIFFAVIATFINLFTQRVILNFGQNQYYFLGAIALGTLTGLATKYLLDKRWIFRDVSAGLEAQSRQFALYTAMGLATTAIFWTTETIFWVIWKTDVMREAGAIIGLAFGYLLKFNLDRRFVFTDSRLRVLR